MANSQTVDVAADSRVDLAAHSATGCTVLVGSKEVTFRQGEKFDYHGDRVGIRVALFDGRDTRVLESEEFVSYAKRSARNFDEVMVEYVEACPREPSAPLRYSPLQELVEANQIVVFRLYPGGHMRRVRFSRRGGKLPENLSADPDLVSELFRLFDEPTIHDLIYLQLRPHLDHTHVPNIGAGRFNGRIEGRSILGDSHDPKIGKRMQLVQTPRVRSTLDMQIPSVAVFTPGEDTRNALDSPYLMRFNMETDRRRWREFLAAHKVEATDQEADDLYLAINAGCLIGSPDHLLETVNKRDRELFWRPAHTGDKVVGVGPVMMGESTVTGILKGTRLDWPVLGGDFLVADAFKGEAPNAVDSRVVYAYPTEYMSNGWRYGQLPITTGLYADRLGHLERIAEALDGERTPELVAMMAYDIETEDGRELRLPKSAEVLRLSQVGFHTPGAWFSFGLDDMFLGYVRKVMTRSDMLIWKVLTPTIGRKVEEVFVP
ncbi:hypothetical protein CMK11_09510, partial [Candidatus Poribacteria bacterium]|nr:hypothetical protein [Candidatus Poribacteria bacterium]